MVGAKTHGNSQYPCSFEWYNDLWIVKANRNGRSLWQREYGGDKYEEAHDVVQNSDGGKTMRCNLPIESTYRRWDAYRTGIVPLHPGTSLVSVGRTEVIPQSAQGGVPYSLPGPTVSVYEW